MREKPRFVKQIGSELVHAPKESAAELAFLMWWQVTLRSIIRTYLDQWLPVLRPEGVSDVKFSLHFVDSYYSRRSKLSKRRIHFGGSQLQEPTETIEFVVLRQLVDMVPDRSGEWREDWMDKHLHNWREYARKLPKGTEIVAWGRSV